MQKREKILAGVIAGLLALGSGVKYGPAVLESVSGSGLAAREDRLEKLQTENEKRFSEIVRGYKALGRMALGRDPETARLRLDAEIKKLADAAKLDKPQYSPKKPTLIKRKNYWIVPYSISADATLEQAVSFITLFYERPYLMRITDYSLTPTGGKDQKLVRLLVNVDAMVLPELDLEFDDQDPLANYPLAPSDPEQWKGFKGYIEDNLLAYAEIWKGELFSPYEPPPPPPPPPPIKNPPPPRQTELKTTPPPQPIKVDPARQETVLTGIVGSDDIRELVTEHNKTKERGYYRAGEEFDGGKIVLVHPMGAVVHKNDKEYVYLLGELLSASQELVSAAFPEITSALLKQRASADARASK
jgi:hypothetical protein